MSDPLQSKHLGRRGAIFVSACLCVMAAIGAACATEWWQELIWRLVLGIGLGAKASVTPVFGAEVSPSHLRYCSSSPALNLANNKKVECW